MSNPLVPVDPLASSRLSALELLVATHTKAGEWGTFLAILRLAGYDVHPEGIRKVSTVKR